MDETAVTVVAVYDALMQELPSEAPLSFATERLVVVSRLAGNAFLAAAGFIVVAWAILLGSVLLDLETSFLSQSPDPGFRDYAVVALNYGTGYLWTATALAGLGAGFRVYAASQYVRQEHHDELIDAIEGRSAASVTGGRGS